MPDVRLARRSSTLYALVGVAISCAVLGVVMADSHDPIGVPADLVPVGGAQVATFALG